MVYLQLMEHVRSQLNKITNFDFVHVSGQHTLRTHLMSVFNSYNIDTVLDVGANTGQFALQLRKLGFAGEIHSFEPIAEVYCELADNAKKDKHWFTYNLALGSAPGETVINVSRGSVFSSILNANAYGRNKWDEMELDHKERVKLETVDNVIAMHIKEGGRKIFLKMDTQGYDLNVFAGANRSLSNISGLLTELSLTPIYEGMPTYLEALSIYNSKGFCTSGFFPVTRSDDLSLIEVDCVLLRGKRTC